MSYVEDNLLSGEDIIYTAKIHWFIFVPGITTLMVSFYLMLGIMELWTMVAGSFLFFLAIFMLGNAVITTMTTELAITSKRVIAKTGFIRRSTAELNHSKVESFNINQSIFGRILGFGTLIIHGTGGGKTLIPSIDHPMEFRKSAMEVIDLSGSP